MLVSLRLAVVAAQKWRVEADVSVKTLSQDQSTGIFAYYCLLRLAISQE